MKNDNNKIKDVKSPVNKYSANFFDSAYQRFRKRNAWMTSLT